MSRLAAADAKRRLRRPAGLEDEVSEDRSEGLWCLDFGDSGFAICLIVAREFGSWGHVQTLL